MNSPSVRIRFAIVFALNALLPLAAIAALLLPSFLPAGLVFSILLWTGTFEYVRSLLTDRGRESIPILLLGCLVFLLLPLFHFLLSMASHPAPLALLGLRSLVLLPSILIAGSSLKTLIKNRSYTDSVTAPPKRLPLDIAHAGAWKPSFKGLFLPILGLVLSFVALFIVRRAWSAPAGGMFGVFVPQSLPFAGLALIHLGAWSSSLPGACRSQVSGA